MPSPTPTLMTTLIDHVAEPVPDGAPPATADSSVTMPAPAPATSSRFAAELLGALIAGGVRDFVVSPGSRSQALALAAAEFEARGAARLHVRIDERSAGFFAIGIARESGTPAAVITTSGTAVANLHPAVLEAQAAQLPLLVLSADRPAELRGIRSNQTTTQPGIFAGAVTFERDVEPVAADGASAVAATLAHEALAMAASGAVHLNLQLREPLSSPGAVAAVVAANAAAVGPAVDARGERFVHQPAITFTPHTVVIAGADAGADAEAFARSGDWPLIAEVSSGAHFGPNLVVPYRELLANPDLAAQIERVVVFGHPTLSREVIALCARADVEVLVVAPAGGEWFNPGRRATRLTAVPTFEIPDASAAPPRLTRAWLGQWVMASRAILAAADAAENPPQPLAATDDTGHVADYQAQRAFLSATLDRVREPVTRRMLAQAVWGATWPHDRLVLGASRLIRELDKVATGRKIRVHANRGLAGIDGTIATALGVAAASQGGDAAIGATRVLLGDLALLHDVGSLLLTPGEQRPRILVIVGNDGGGTIFDTLEVAGTAPAATFDRVLYTPHEVSIRDLAAAYGWAYLRADTRGELDTAMGTPVVGPTILEVPLAR
ncbi:MAG TPA: 2-succinyl-5-enolpyruvyl-6-hydroxy-3-cyclohexene-1-carboxylic-acid synthase [Candidatus Lumbricidophila sp.]|nr:2-succinyl-5-enolpyruvyl-6-hydroxy-3-cyclohexene-1-carboxylic-acid synthase [Candidatus Lumbricidophila sp.]